MRRMTSSIARRGRARRRRQHCDRALRQTRRPPHTRTTPSRVLGGALRRATTGFCCSVAPPSKYHFGGRWSNSCCGHPRPGEDIVAAAGRRVAEELGLQVVLDEISRFEYRAEDPASGLVEHEIDHVMRGSAFGARLGPDPGELDAWQWIDKPSLDRWMISRPDDFTPWFARVMDNVGLRW